MPGGLADKPPMCSFFWRRQTPRGLHPHIPKAQGDIVPSDPFLSQQGANMAAGNLFLCCSLGRTQAPCPTDWQTAYVLSSLAQADPWRFAPLEM